MGCQVRCWSPSTPEHECGPEEENRKRFPSFPAVQAIYAPVTIGSSSLAAAMAIARSERGAWQVGVPGAAEACAALLSG